MAFLRQSATDPNVMEAVEGGSVIATGTLQVELIPTGTRHGSIQFITTEPYQPPQNEFAQQQNAVNAQRLAEARV